MNGAELTSLIKGIRGLDPEAHVDTAEEWDSLDHLAIVAEIVGKFPQLVADVDLSDANSIDKLSILVCE